MMAQTAASKIENIPQDQIIETNPIKTCLFDWLPRYIMPRKDISAALKIVLSVLYGSLGDNCKVFYRIDTLSERTGLSTRTIKRAIAKGRELKLFLTMETGRGLNFRLIDQSRRPVDKVTHEIGQNDPSLIIDENNTLKEKKIHQPPPKQAPTSSTKVRPLHQSKPVLFSQKQIEKMGDYFEPIECACRDILELPARSGIPFNPMQAVGQSLKQGKQPGAISETLIGMAKSWATIETPWGIYTRQLKIKNQNWNARQSEDESERLKKIFD